MKMINYIETVELKTNSTTKTKFYFSEQPNLRNKRIIYIDLNKVDNVSKSPSGLAIVNGGVFAKSFLVLVSKNNEVINRIPIDSLLPSKQCFYHLLIDRVVDFPKSYVQVGSTDALDASETFLFTFYCQDMLKSISDYSVLNVENIEVKTTPADKQIFKLPDHENLRGKKIQFIDYIGYDVTMTPNGAYLVNINVFKKSYLNLVSKGKEIVKNIPIYILRSSDFNGYRIPLDNIDIDLPNSYFFVADTNDTVADQVFFMNVYFYEKILSRTRSKTKPPTKLPERMRRFRKLTR